MRENCISLFLLSIKEDFYGFINAGNNIIRTFEENGKSINEAKKYMKYLLAHNIM